MEHYPVALGEAAGSSETQRRIRLEQLCARQAYSPWKIALMVLAALIAIILFAMLNEGGGVDSTLVCQLATCGSHLTGKFTEFAMKQR